MTRAAQRRRHLNLAHLESFVALVDCQGVTAAAKRLKRSQPTVSQHLQRLETQLRRQLFTRSRTGATLTHEGLRLLPFARHLLRLNEQFAEMPEHVALRLGACSNIGVYLLPDLLIEFRRRGHVMPDVSIAGNPEVVRRFTAAELDVALLEWWVPRPGFESRIWRQEPLVAILPGDHPLAAQDHISLSQLRHVPILGGEAGTGTGRLLIDCLHGKPPIDVAMNLGSTEAVKRAVCAGLGASIVLLLTVADHATQQRPTLAIRPLRPALCKPLHLVWRSELSREHPLLSYLGGAAGGALD